MFAANSIANSILHIRGWSWEL